MGEQGRDWRTSLTQRAVELKFQRTLEIENDLPPGSLSSLIDIVNERVEEAAVLPKQTGKPA